MVNPNYLVLIPNGDGPTIVVFSSISRFNIVILESSQQLVALFQQAKFWAPWD
jgi:hypothetical protein